jgi:hypothetical protein
MLAADLFFQAHNPQTMPTGPGGKPMRLYLAASQKDFCLILLD